MINERQELIQDCIDRTAQTRDLVFELLKHAKLNDGYATVSEEALSRIWANIGNIMYELSQANNEITSLAEFITISIPIPE